MSTRVFDFIRKGTVATAFASLLFTVPFSGTATAQLTSERTMVTFSNSVEVPGHILPAGTYYFERTQLPKIDPDVIQIFDSTGQGLVATVLCRAEIWNSTMKHPLVQMDETAAGQTPRVRQFVARGATYGHIFLYGRSEEGR
jgi:hypothetical protein